MCRQSGLRGGARRTHRTMQPLPKPIVSIRPLAQSSPPPARRPVLVAVASGKGGVGKSTSVANLGLLLARRGMSVVIVDLDVGGADMHIMFGELSPATTLSQFLNKQVTSLDDVAHPIAWCPRLRLIAGTGETLRNTNPAAATKKKLERHVRELDADVVLLDIGAGTNYHALDFFLWADVPIAVATPDPTSVLDLYKFVKLAAVRRVSSVLGAKDPVSENLNDQDLRSLDQLLVDAAAAGEEVEMQVRAALTRFRPCLLFNHMGRSHHHTMQRLQSVIRQFLGSDADVLGEVPEDEAVKRSIRKFLPVVESEPESPAAIAFGRVETELRARLRQAYITPR